MLRSARTLLAAVVFAGFAVSVTADAKDALPAHVVERFGTPPPMPEGPLSAMLRANIETAFVEAIRGSSWGPPQAAALERVAAAGDPRVAWIVADLMRFAPGQRLSQQLADAAAKLLGVEPPRENHWGAVTDRLIAWDVPAPPGYLAVKRDIFMAIVPGWEPLFREGAIDWRHVSWGGVPIDDRPFGRTDDICNCIPAADNPKVTSAEEAGWLADDAIVFGVSINGEHRAYPRRIMEVREMVNDTLGGRDLAIPYCTLCGAAQAYFTDRVPAGVKRPVIRTSGLLIRSNKVMFDLETMSVFDTFKGTAVAGPLHEKGVTLPQASVVTTTWGAWKDAHPDTTVLAEELALGRDFDFRNNRDANGPIFPVGDVDPRLPVHEDVIGVVTAAGRAIAFQRSKAVAALTQGQEIAVEDVRLVLEAGGVKAVDEKGDDLGSHEAFWFAWSQFYPDTVLWEG